MVEIGDDAVADIADAGRQQRQASGDILMIWQGNSRRSGSM